MVDLIKRDLDSWSKKQTYPTRIHISVSGGIGDQLCAQPSIRYICSNSPDTIVYLSTHHTELFNRLGYDNLHVYKHGEFKPEPDTAYIYMDAFPPPNSNVFSVVSANLCHTIDYISIALLKRILPVDDKRIKLDVKLDDMCNLIDIIGLQQIDNMVLIHAGKHWDTKTLPRSYWAEIIQKLIDNGIKVCLIGKTSKDCAGGAGVYDFEEFGDKVINTVDLLDLRGLIGIISAARCLISNDSSPIHIAGAFDNEIIVIPTVKHPEHILPFRAKPCYAFCKRLLLDDYETLYYRDGITTIDKMKYDWDRYLVDSDSIVDTIRGFYGS